MKDKSKKKRPYFEDQGARIGGKHLNGRHLNGMRGAEAVLVARNLPILHLGKDCDYERELSRLQVELVKLQEWVRHEKLRVVVLFEGRDAAGKGGKDKTVGVLLDTGGVQPGNLSVVGASSSVSPGSVTRLARESVLLRMSLDGGRPQKRRWQLLPKSDAIYQYWGEGETAVGSILSPGQFLEKILGAKLLTIEFQPFSQQATFPSQFLPAGLKQEFQHHKACGLD